ncbi:unnamed protein product [Citrullus colocynthis]|uniref:Transmembrane protein n=1 Tax=Citrullus colocynthis TaxID=252529 RepID=A0ABP0YBZ9_9ROSI
MKGIDEKNPAGAVDWICAVVHGFRLNRPPFQNSIPLTLNNIVQNGPKLTPLVTFQMFSSKKNQKQSECKKVPTMKSIFIIMVIAIVWLINQINGSPHSSTAPSNSNALKILSEAYSGPSNRGIGHRN